MRRTIVRLSLVMSTLFVAQKQLHAMESVPALKKTERELGDASAQKRCNALVQLVENHKTAPVSEKLSRVNDFFNQVPYQSDIANWGSKDYWAAPLEMLSRGRADCEDYAIAKFFTLLQMGLPQEKLYLTFVRLPQNGELHFVLTYYETPDAIPLVLDNRSLQIRPVRFGESLQPVYRFNLEEFVSYHDDGTQHHRAMEGMPFRKWQELTRRMRLAKLAT